MADDLGDRAADAGIDFVEHHRRHRIEAQRGDLDRQRDARQLAAGGDLAQRPRRLAGIGGDQEFDAFAALRVRAARGRPVRARPRTAAAHAELARSARSWHRDKAVAAVARALRQRVGGAAPVLGGSGDLAIAVPAGARRRRAAIRARRPARRAARPVPRAHAVLAREFVQAREACVPVRRIRPGRDRGRRARGRAASAASSSWIAAASSMASTSARRGSCSLHSRARSPRTCCSCAGQCRGFAAEPGEGDVAGRDAGLRRAPGGDARHRVRRASPASRASRSSSSSWCASQSRRSATSPGRHRAPWRAPPARRSGRSSAVPRRATRTCEWLMAAAGIEQGQLAAASTAAPGVRAGRGSRPAARPARRAAQASPGRPLIHAREPPSARSVRRSWQASPSSNSCSRSHSPRFRGRIEVEFGMQLGAFGAVADHAAVGALRRTGSPAHRPAATCRRRFRRKSRSGPRRIRVRPPRRWRNPGW